MTTDSFPYSVSLDLALKGTGAPPATAYAAAVKDARQALSAVLHAREKLEVLSIVKREDDLAAAAKVAEDLSRDTSEIFVMGMGGSSMGARALAAIAPYRPNGPKVHILDNLDPASFGDALDRADLKTTRFVAVSKSGSTAETLAQTLTAADAIIRSGGGKHLKQHFAVVTEPKPTALKQFAGDLGCAVLDHPLGIGGRYAVLSVVGLLPALLMGMDAKAVREGAASVLTDANEAPAEGAALHHAFGTDLKETVQWAYADALGPFGFWWRQLWAESLGKDGKGAMPVPATGPCDQHSQLQLYLDGPGGTLFTSIVPDTAGKGPAVPAEAAKKLGLDYLAGRTIGDVVDAEARATAETLAKRGRPVRVIRIKTIDERALGALFMHFILETVVMAKLMGVNAFDQPAVEEGKILARKYLAGKT